LNLEARALASLTSAQRHAWRLVRETVHERHAHARAHLLRILSGSGCPEETLDVAAETIRQHARVVVHFHPDRIGVKPITAEALLEEGEYRSQFETGLSSGSLTAFPGGARDRWEESLFGGAYHVPDALIGDRPKYGALEVIRYPDGPWPRFGSCYFVLREDVSWRTSFTFSGSEQPDAAERLGTIDEMACVLAPLFAEVASGGGAQVPWPPHVAPTLGVEHLTVPGLIERVCGELPPARASSLSGPAGRVLDTGIEAPVHGPIRMDRDIERLVADPAFIGRQPVAASRNCLAGVASRSTGMAAAAWQRPTSLTSSAAPRSHGSLDGSRATAS
jgi:hypothetical protein